MNSYLMLGPKPTKRKGSAKPGSPSILSCAETPPADFGQLGR